MDEKRETGDDERYYVRCPMRETGARVAVTICVECQFVTIENKTKIGCAFPVSKKYRGGK